MNNNKEYKSNLDWAVSDIWNQLLGLAKRYPPKVRDYISPSDIGKHYWFRYQKMMGVPETNPFEDRVLRIFAAGDEFHHLIRNVFRACGILLKAEEWSVIPATDKTLKVLGKYDIIAGGLANVEQAKKYCEEWNFSDFVAQRTIMMAEKLLKKYPVGMPKLLYEIKSINSMAFWNKKDYLQDAYPWHTLQCYAYLKAENLPEGRVLYVSKDDLMTAEFAVKHPDPELEKEFQKDLMAMTTYIKEKLEPSKPNYFNFNPMGKIRFQRNKEKYVIDGCWEISWEVSRSVYFTKLTGFKKVDEWELTLKDELKRKNDEIKQKYIEEKNL